MKERPMHSTILFTLRTALCTCMLAMLVASNLHIIAGTVALLYIALLATVVGLTYA
jgi:hypothetical protein